MAIEAANFRKFFPNLFISSYCPNLINKNNNNNKTIRPLRLPVIYGFLASFFFLPSPVHGSDISIPTTFALMSDCSSFATASGGVNIQLVVYGDVIDGQLFNSSLQLGYYSNLLQPDGQKKQTFVTQDKTACTSPTPNLFTCPAPKFSASSDSVFNGQRSLAISPCAAAETSSGNKSVSSTNATCYRFLLNGKEIAPNDKNPIIFYYKDPVFSSAAFNGRQHLSIFGEGVSLWIKLPPCNTVGGKKNAKAVYNISAGGYKCEISWDDLNDTNLDCGVDVSNPVKELSGQMVTISVGFRNVSLPITSPEAATSAPSTTSNISFLVPVIVVPVVAFLSGCVTLIVCLLRRYRPRKADSIPSHGMVAYPNVVIRPEDLPPALKEQVDPLRLDENDISLGALIGSGFFGEVRRAIMRKDGAGCLVAVKFFKGTGSLNDLCDFLREAVIMCQFKHKNVLECFGIFFSSDNRVAIVVPYMEESDLRHYVINNADQVGFAEIVDFALQIAEGMHYLSTMGFVHRDLAARNCLIDSAHAVKISDFGMSRTITDSDDYYKVDDLSSRPLPVRWMAPESLRTGRFTIKTDVWSFGILLWELCTKGGFPFADMESYVVTKRVSSGYFLERTSDIPESLYSVMRRCWSYEPPQRATFAELVEILSELKAKTPGADVANYVQVTRDDDYMLPSLETASTQPIIINNNNHNNHLAEPGPDYYNPVAESPTDISASGRATPISLHSLRASSGNNADANNNSGSTVRSNQSSTANYYHDSYHEPALTQQPQQQQQRNGDVVAHSYV